MARGRATNGSGMQPRKRKDGLWEARFIAGTDPKTGKQIRKSVYGKTAAEVAEKLRAATASVDAGTYLEPQRMFLRDWLDVWLSEYCGAIKPGTLKAYSDNVKNHIKPGLGTIRLCELQPHDVQHFINGLQRGDKPLSAKSVKNIHGVLCKALSEVLRIKYIASNPAAGAILPKVVREEIQDNPSEAIFFVALNTGMRLSEILGLRWSRVNFIKGMIKVDAQLLVKRGKDSARELGLPKNSKPRSFKAAPDVIDCLRLSSVNRWNGACRPGKCGRILLTWCSPMRSGRRFHMPRWSIAFTICATPSPSKASAPGWMSKPRPPTLATAPSASPSTFTATSPAPCRTTQPAVCRP